MNRFGLIQSKLALDNEPVITQNTYNEELSLQRSLLLQTARKRKAAPRTNLLLERPMPMNFEESDITSLSQTELITVIKCMHEGPSNSMMSIKIVYDALAKPDMDTQASLMANEERWREIQARVGIKPELFHNAFEGPIVWSTLSLMGSYLTQISADVDDRIAKRLKSLQPNLELETIRIFEKELNGIHGHIDTIKGSIKSVAQTVLSQYHLATVSTPARSNTTAQSTPGLESRLLRLEKEIESLKAINDLDVIRFFSLGFKSIDEARAWISLHYKADAFGFIVDAHMIIKDGDDSLTNNVVLAKNKLHTAYEALVFTSYDRKALKLFKERKKYRFIASLDSYFDVICCYRDWRVYETGYRARILAALNEMKLNFEHHLSQELDKSSLLYQVAFQSLLVAISWIEDFVRYIDEVYEEYTESKFDARRAWNITTWLAMALLDIAVPRTRVKKAMYNKNRVQIKEITFYGSIQSLDRMTVIYKAGFKISPIVANELVKVLAKNTQVGGIERICSGLLELSNDVITVKEKALKRRN